VMKSRSRLNLFSFILLAFGLCLCAAATLSAQPPDNIILLISDGCGYDHICAASLYQFGQTHAQTYEQFPVQLAVATYSFNGSYDPNLAWTDFDYVRSGYTDSAAAATAMATGVKTLDGMVGLDPNGDRLLNVTERAEFFGKATGVVTSVPFTHSTPAGFVAHNPSRDNFRQIAEEIIYESAVDVVFGCGHPFYNNNGVQMGPDFEYVGHFSIWLDILNATAGADADNDGIPDPWILIETLDQFQNLPNQPDPNRVLAVPRIHETLQEKRSGNQNAPPYVVPFIQTVPTLPEMTTAALSILEKDPDGFFVMIEGGAVDWASHDNLTGRMIEEQIDFDLTVDAVIDWINQNSSWDDTLVIVTSDHECGYLTGPGSGHTPSGPVWKPLVNHGQGNVPGLEWHHIMHTNALVPLFAKGAGAQLFQNYIDGNDPVRGPYIDNTAIAKVIFSLLNNPPVAVPGPNQTAYADLNNLAQITLDANDSYDPDADPLTHLWTWTIDSNTYEANSVSPIIKLPAGQHTIQLIVNDGFTDSEPNYLTITVVPPLTGPLHLLPSRISRWSRNKRVFAILRLPQNITPEDIDPNNPLLLYPGQIQPKKQIIFKTANSATIIFAAFKKSDILDTAPDDGPVDFNLTARLKTGQFLYGSDQIYIAPNPPRNNHPQSPPRNLNRSVSAKPPQNTKN